MTAMNWEGIKRRGRTSDYCGDDLPLIGSWEDRRRYGALPPLRRQQNPASGPLPTRSRQTDFDGLQIYVEHASHWDFMRKPLAMRKETVEIISRLHSRCIQWQAPLLPREVNTLQDAVRLVNKLRTTNYREQT
jgi:hypothetical protein